MKRYRVFKVLYLVLGLLIYGWFLKLEWQVSIVKLLNVLFRNTDMAKWLAIYRCGSIFWWHVNRRILSMVLFFPIFI